MPKAGQSGNQPDFASTYGTPGLAGHLWRAVLFLSDTYREDPHSKLLWQELPPVAQRLADDAWIERFVSSFKTLADRPSTGSMRFNAFLDGIEDDSSGLAEQYRLVNLHPRDWFDAPADVTDT